MNTSNSLDSDLLRTFLTVARYGNVTRAADALHRTQSAVSVQIKRLEGCLKAKLFRREARGMSLTHAGERLQVAAERVVSELDETVQMFHSDPIGGLVRVGIPDEYGLEVLPTILADFTARYPSVEVFVQCGFSVEFPQAVKRGELDLAVFADEALPSSVPGKLIQDPMEWVASRRFHCRPDVPVPLALFNRACSWRDLTIEALDKVNQPYKIVFSSESVAGIKAAVSTGLAVGVLARTTVGRDMHILKKRDGFPRLPNSLVRLERGESQSPAIDAMVSAIENGFRRFS